MSLTSEIKEILARWKKLSTFIEKKHPENASTGRASTLSDNICLSHFRKILDGRRRITSLNKSLLNRSANENAGSAAKKVIKLVLLI